LWRDEAKDRLGKSGKGCGGWNHSVSSHRIVSERAGVHGDKTLVNVGSDPNTKPHSGPADTVESENISGGSARPIAMTRTAF